MRIKFESDDAEILREFHQFIYKKAPEIEINESYKDSLGFQKEPMVIAIIAALGGPSILKELNQILKEFLAHKEKVLKDKMKHQEELLKISINRGKNWEIVSSKDLSDTKYNEE